MDKRSEHFIKINEYREKTRVKPEPVVVKRGKTEKNQVLFVVIKATEQECKDMNKTKTINEDLLIDIIEKYKYIESIKDIQSVLHCGDLNNVKFVKNYLYKFPYRERDRRERKEEQFRCYTYTLEKQKEMLNVINSCPTVERSWSSVIEKVGSRFGLFLYIVKPL